MPEPELPTLLPLMPWVTPPEVSASPINELAAPRVPLPESAKMSSAVVPGPASLKLPATIVLFEVRVLLLS